MLKIPEWTHIEMKQTGVDYSNVLGLRSRAPECAVIGFRATYISHQEIN